MTPAGVRRLCWICWPCRSRRIACPPPLGKIAREFGCAGWVGGPLRQAESSTNPHEAEAFLAAAQRIRPPGRSIDPAVALAHTRDRAAVPVRRQINLGQR
ncbi:DUF2786 domain-containing protein [Nocardia vaccinii]|uniref:DUF2786 domain-containing protein n=1 Tax=Nocardia vaccinii TaxID=1822 RepID=UPI0027D7E7DE|nr:DUF2786 domain-containing protein [Nocardia vaccinii]